LPTSPTYRAGIRLSSQQLIFYNQRISNEPNPNPLTLHCGGFCNYLAVVYG
jgi:hypothetical protein